MFDVPENLRVRFAPSPTGYLHIGGARTALFNWLLARRYRGKFVLRIEDTDELRSTDESTGGILQGLRWLGLNWDEGPEVGGPHAPYIQSERKAMHLEYARRLVEAGAAYFDRKTPPPAPGEKPEPQIKIDRRAYDPESRSLPPAAQLEMFDAGAEFPLRIKCPHGKAEFRDAVRGSVVVDYDDVGDIVILKRNRGPVYNFTVVVDDAEMKINFVLRGEDHISNTPKQLAIYGLLEIEPPAFCHVPLILGEDKKRLSKRHGATDVLEYKAQGYLPDAMINFLALIGWNPGDDREIMSRDELVAAFSIDGLGASSGVYNAKKLDNFQGVHVRSTSPEDIARLLVPFVPETYRRESARYHKVVELLHDRIVKFSEAAELMRYFFEEPKYNDAAVKKFLTDNPDWPRLAPLVLDELKSAEPFTAEQLEPRFRLLCTRLSLGMAAVLQPVRVAVTGDKFSPGMFETLELLGRETAIERVGKFAAQKPGGTKK
ncbi:MAG: glutamate--tRNA ligase [bacterium]|jgi:glutamyl-tRNA synthetase